LRQNLDGGILLWIFILLAGNEQQGIKENSEYRKPNEFENLAHNENEKIALPKTSDYFFKSAVEQNKNSPERCQYKFYLSRKIFFRNLTTRICKKWSKRYKWMCIFRSSDCPKPILPNNTDISPPCLKATVKILYISLLRKGYASSMGTRTQRRTAN